MNTSGTCPFAAARGGLGRCSRDKCQHKVDAPKSGELRQVSDSATNTPSSRFKLFRPNANDNMRQSFNAHEPKAANPRPQSACNLNNMNLIQQAIRDYGNVRGSPLTMTKKESNLGAQRQLPDARQNQRPCTGTACRDGRQRLSNGPLGRDHLIERDARNRQRQPKRVFQAKPTRPSANGESTLRSQPVANQKTYNDTSRVPEGLQKREVNSDALHSRVRVQHGAPTVIEVRSLKSKNLSDSGGERKSSIGYALFKYSQNLQDLDDCEMKPQADIRKNSVKSIKNAGDGLLGCSCGESGKDRQLRKGVGTDGDQKRNSKSCNQHVCNAHNLPQHKVFPRRKSRGEQQYKINRYSNDRKGEEQLSNHNCPCRTSQLRKLSNLSRQESSCDLNLKLSKQSEQRPGSSCSNKPTLSYNAQTNSKNGNCSENSSADSVSNSEPPDTLPSKCEKTKNSVKKTFEVSSNNTIVITPGMPTLIEVRSLKDGKGKSVIQTTQLAEPDLNNECQSGDESSERTSCDTASVEACEVVSNTSQQEEKTSQPPGDYDKPSLSNKKSERTEPNLEKTQPDKQCKKKSCSKCNKNREITFAQPGKGFIMTDREFAKPQDTSLQGEFKRAINDIAYTHGAYVEQPQPTFTYQAPALQYPPPQYQPMPYPIQGQPQQYQSMYPGQCPYPPAYPAPFQAMNQYQP